MADRPWYPAIVVGLCLALYLPTLGDGFVWDDRIQILLNSALADWSFVWKSLARDVLWFRDPYHLPQSPHYRPLWDIWLALNYHAFGRNAALWHAVRIGLHGLAVFLVYRIARGLAPGEWAALGAALLFGVLPIQVSAVAWASTPELPAACLELGAFCLFLGRDRGRWRQPVAVLLFAAALLMTEQAITFAGIPATFVLLVETGGRRLRRALIAAAPYAAIAVAYLVLRRSVLGLVVGLNEWGHLSLADVASTIPWKLLAYFGMLAAPLAAGPVHSPVPAVGLVSLQFWVPLAGLAAVGAAGLCLFRRHQHRSLYLFCALWFLLAVAPVLIIGGPSAHIAMQDRYLYFASAGWCIALADIAAGIVWRGAVARGGIIVGGALLVLAYGVVAARAQQVWHDEIRLFAECIRRAPQVAVWHEGLGRALSEHGDAASALHEFATGVALDPAALRNEAGAFLVLGRSLEWQHRAAEAADAYRLAATVEPKVATFHAELAHALYALGRDREALDEARVALDLDPGDESAKRLVATIVGRLGTP